MANWNTILLIFLCWIFVSNAENKAIDKEIFDENDIKKPSGIQHQGV